MEPQDYGDNYRTAMILERISNMAGKSLKKPVKVEDFLHKAEKKTAQTADEQKAFFKRLRGE